MGNKVQKAPQFGEHVTSSSISNLIRLGLLFVETSLDNGSVLVSVEIAGERRARGDLSGLKDELSNIYYQLSLAADNVEYHKLNHYYIQGDKRFYFLLYDTTRRAKKLVEIFSPSKK